MHYKLHPALAMSSIFCQSLVFNFQRHSSPTPMAATMPAAPLAGMTAERWEQIKDDPSQWSETAARERFFEAIQR